MWTDRKVHYAATKVVLGLMVSLTHVIMEDICLLHGSSMHPELYFRVTNERVAIQIHDLKSLGKPPKSINAS